MAVTENRVAGLQERLKEVMKCEQLNKKQFMKVTDISNIGRKLDGKVAITKVDIWYTARRSWATIASSIDIPKEVIGKALGHSEWDSDTTSLYIQFDNKKIDEANRKVIDYLNG